MAKTASVALDLKDTYCHFTLLRQSGKGVVRSRWNPFCVGGLTRIGFTPAISQTMRLPEPQPRIVKSESAYATKYVTKIMRGWAALTG